MWIARRPPDSVEQKIHRSLGRLEVHELRLAFGRRHLVLAELVAVLAGQIALVGEIHHQRLERENVRQRVAAARGTESRPTITLE